MIDLLYAGELIDYIRCIDVDYSSERNDKFLDFSLAIVPFGSNKALHSLSECIETFLRPEILDGENKYYAEKFDKKVDAIKGKLNLFLFSFCFWDDEERKKICRFEVWEASTDLICSVEEVRV